MNAQMSVGLSAIALRKDLVTAYVGRATALAKSGQSARAAADIKTAEALKPDDSATLTDIASVYLALRRYDLALSYLDRAVALDPKDPRAFNDRCWTRAVWGRDLDAALADCARSLGMMQGDTYSYVSRALVYLKQGKPALAVDDCDAAVKIDPKDADAFYLRGRAKLAAGDGKGGDADIAAAKALDAGIADEYAQYGSVP